MASLRSLLWRRRFPVWHDPAYRLPSATVDNDAGMEPRRADFVVWALRAARAVGEGDLRAAPRVSYGDMARVHTPAYLASLHDPRTLARIFAVDESAVLVDEILGTLRLACGATLAAAREVLRRGGPALNLFGGFHHAAPSQGGGFCALNDIAIAVAALRADGFRGRVVVIDLDAHPPDGLAACFKDDRSVWVGSLSGCEWEPLETIDETVLPQGCEDGAYLAALDGLLGRMPHAAMAFVIAGGDVIAGDHLGRLGMTLDGARRRDERVARTLERVPSVWLPGGGYHGDSWKVLAGTGLVLAGRGREPVRAGDPLAQRFKEVSRGLDPHRLGAELDLDLGEIEAELDGRKVDRRLLGFYTAEGLEYAVASLGLLDHLERLGYSAFRVAIDHHGVGDRACLYGLAGGIEHLLIETVVERRAIGDRPMLFVHWLTLRHPRAVGRKLLPGQEVPGLGLAREMTQIFARMAARLELAGVALRPSHYHIAVAAARRGFRFLDGARQRRFEALMAQLANLDVATASVEIEAGRVELDGAPYTWEPDDMVDTISG